MILKNFNTMKRIQAKSLLTLIIILIIIGISTSANTFIGNDLVANRDSIPIDTVTSDFYVITNPYRVLFPETLEEHRKESKKYIKKYIREQHSYIQLMFRRGKKYMPTAIKILDKYGVPREFRFLAALESNFSAHAVSPVGAVGYWQFMAPLAKQYGLKIGGKYDERKNFRKSTTAAAKFFRDQLKAYDGDMLLTAASYNCGPGRVSSSIRKSGKKDADFWDIQEYLPSETRKFVKRFVALNVVYVNYTNFLQTSMDFEGPHSITIASTDSALSLLVRPPIEL